MLEERVRTGRVSDTSTKGQDGRRGNTRIGSCKSYDQAKRTVVGRMPKKSMCLPFIHFRCLRVKSKHIHSSKRDVRIKVKICEHVQSIYDVHQLYTITQSTLFMADRLTHRFALRPSMKIWYTLRFEGPLAKIRARTLPMLQTLEVNLTFTPLL